MKKNYFYSHINIDRKSHKRLHYFFIAPLMCLLALEAMHLCYPNSIPVFFSSPYFLLKLLISYIFILLSQSFIYALTQNDFLANLINSFIYLALGYSTEVLGRVTGDPLLPTDILLIKNVGEIAGFAKIPFFISSVIALAVYLYSLYVHKKICKLEKNQITLKKRILAFILSVILFISGVYLTCFNYNFRHKLLKKIDVPISAFNPISDYNSNGIILTFFPRIGDIFAKQPDNYSRLQIESLKNKYDETNITSGNIKPNVIIIQNEAWWNPHLLPDVTYDKNLFAEINSINSNIYRGEFVTSVYAGGTCMPEFEVLTGLSTQLLPASVYPYIQYVTRETPSIASIYKDNGYQTVALHPYRKNFYNRSKAYPLLGFDTFKGMEEFDYKDVSGAYIDDMSCSKQIIKEFENKKSDRIFEFVVTMENHGAYDLPRYQSFDFNMSSETLSEEDYNGLIRYSQGVYNADKAFKALVDYFSAVDEPVIIAMYGDHLPLLGTNGSTYIDGGLIPETDNFVSSDYDVLYRTPYVVWSNCNIKIKNLTPKISAANFGTKILMASNVKTPWYYNIINQFYQKYPVYNHTQTYNANMNIIKNHNEIDANLKNDYKMLQYDILNGKQYCKEGQ